VILTGQYATPNASNDTTGKKHANVSRARAYRSSDDKDNASELYRAFPTASVCRPGANDASDDCSGAVHAIESTDDVGGVCVTLFSLGREIEICVD